MVDSRGVYGKELILDLHGCPRESFTRTNIRVFLGLLCGKIDMKREDLHFWDDLETPPEERETEPHLVGTSAVQFIRTSNVTIHTLDLMERVYLNVFSCKDFNAEDVVVLAADFFGGMVVQQKTISRL